MRIQFLGAAHEVTGSCTLLQAAGHKILIDCGLEQGKDLYENSELPVIPGDIACVLVTHAHVDHSGKLPALVAGGFKGNIYTSVPTKKLLNIMLLDSAHIQESEAEWKSRKAKRAGKPVEPPLYTTQDAMKTLEMLTPCEYEKDIEILDGVSIRLRDAGHLLGSASIEVTVTENGEKKTILFSGDLGNVDRPLIKDPQPPRPTDYVVIESTYGNRVHGERSDYATQLAEIIQSTLDKGGNVVVPCFAVGRTQEMLYLIREIKNQGRIKGHPNFPVYVDSPLAVEATNVYSSDIYAYCDDETKALLDAGINPIRFPGVTLSITSDDSKLINVNETPKVILSASGMCEAGRIRHHLKHNLWRPESTILFVGYQSEGTLGRTLLDGAETVKLFGEEVSVHARLAQMDGISGHADMEIMLDWLGAMKDDKPTMVFVNHGEDGTCDDFAATITERLGMEAVAPYNGAIYDLNTCTCLAEGNKQRIQKTGIQTTGGTAGKKGSASAAFDRLLQAGRRLLSVIERNKGGANKDLGKFADQINELSNKWDR